MARAAFSADARRESVDAGDMSHVVLFLLALAALGAQPAATDLDGLKALFPPHVAGPVSSTSDPAVQRLFFKYQSRVERLTTETLATDLLALRREAERDLVSTEKPPARKSAKPTSSQRHAQWQNAVWLRQKLIPYLQRLAQFQRGR